MLPNDVDIEMMELQEDARRMETARRTSGVPFDPAKHQGIVDDACYQAFMAYTATTPLVMEALADHGVTVPDDGALFDAMQRGNAKLSD